MNDLMTDSFLGTAQAAAAGQGPQAGAPAVADEKLHQFLQEADEVKKEMATLQDELARLQAAHDASSKQLAKPPAEASRAGTNAALVKLLRSARQIRTRLASMDRRSASRASAAVTAGLKTRLQELTAGVQGLRRMMSAGHRDAVARYYSTITGQTPTDEMVDRIVSSGVDVDALFKKAVATGNVAAAVQEMEKRQEEAKEVEGSLGELQQLFLDMSVLVAAQGKQVDDIEQHVAAAGHEVADGNQQLEVGRQHQRSSRRIWLWIGLVVLLLVVLAVVAAIILVTINKKQNLLLPLFGIIRKYPWNVNITH